MENCLYLFVSCRPTLPRTAAVCDCYKHNWYITYDGELFVSVRILYPPYDGGGVWLLQTQLIHYVRWRIVCICLYLVLSLWRRRCIIVTLRTMENCLYLFVSCSLPMTAAVCDCYKHNWYITYDRELFVSVCILYPPQDGGGVWLLQTQLIHYVRWRIVCICLYLVPSLGRRRYMIVTNTIDTLRLMRRIVCISLYLVPSPGRRRCVTVTNTTDTLRLMRRIVCICLYLVLSLWRRRCVTVTNTIDTLHTMENCLYLSVSCTLPRTAAVYAVGALKLAFLERESFERLLGPCLDIMKRNSSKYKKNQKGKWNDAFIALWLAFMSTPSPFLSSPLILIRFNLILYNRPRRDNVMLWVIENCFCEIKYFIQGSKHFFFF